jgi:hypothetical protein
MRVVLDALAYAGLWPQTALAMAASAPVSFDGKTITICRGVIQ